MIETTAWLLQHRGYYGTSLNGILAGSGGPRGSLYYHFPGGKDEIVLEATRFAIMEATRGLHDALDAASDPAQGVRLFIDTAADILRQTEYTFGCPVAPVILDASGDLEELAELCRGAFEEWVGVLTAAFAAEGVAKKRARSLALLVESVVEGLLLIGRAYRDPEPLNTVATELESLLRLAMAETKKRAAKTSRRAGKA
jgi:TetR/AcrR family transcriptional repressor of lmrAB and yxaGH operons